MQIFTAPFFVQCEENLSLLNLLLMHSSQLKYAIHKKKNHKKNFTKWINKQNKKDIKIQTKNISIKNYLMRWNKYKIK